MTAKRRPWRLWVRLAWRLAAVMAAGVALAAIGVAWRTFVTIHSLDDAALQSRAEMLADAVHVGGDGRPALHLAPAVAAGIAGSDSESVFLVGDRAGRPVIESRPGVTALLVPVLPPPGTTGFFRVPPSAAWPHGLVGVQIVDDGWHVTVAQAHEQQEALLESLLHEFLVSTLWLLGPIGAATVAIGVLTLRHGLRPLQETSAAAQRVGPGAPAVRLPMAGLPMELAPLVGAVNAALDRLARALDAQRRFTGEAAHALRTPLAVLAARIDSLLPGAVQAALRHDADRLARLVSQMLAIARLDGLPLDVAAPLDLRGIAAEAVASLAPLAVQRGIELALGGEAGLPPVSGNAAAVATALGNLLDNAIAHAPPGTVVEVELVAPATLRVLDRGPGVPDAAREAVFARFHSRRDGGAGLGLAIVAGVAAAHGGSAWVEARAGGVAAFVLQLIAGQGRRPAASQHRADEILPVQHA